MAAQPTHFDILYSITPSHPEAHIFTVVLKIAQPAADGQLLKLPNWIPGSYMIRDFAKNIVRIEATAAGKPVGITQLDKSTWQCEPTSEILEISYDVYAWDLSVRSAHLDQTHAYFNGTSVFLSVEGQTNAPCKVSINKPEGDQYDAWKVGTSMRELDAHRYDFGTYYCEDYDELLDHPVEIADFTMAHFKVCDVDHDVILVGKHYADMERLCDDLTKICKTHIEFFGKPAPMERYVFMTLVVGDGYGGLEHRNSTSLICKRSDLPHPRDVEDVTEGYKNYLGLCSHEYFHTWNVKRIKPAVYLPYDLEKETYTELLWAFEGITSYYDDLGVLRSELINTESYLELLGKTMTRVLGNTGHTKQTATNSSYTTWTRFYKQGEDAPNNIVSYYTKGALIALCLDLTIRSQTQNKYSLDQIMAYLWEHFGKVAKGVENDTFQNVIQTVAGIDLTEFFNKALYTTDALPIKTLLEEHGVALHTRPLKNATDAGGKAETGTPNLYTGIKAKANNIGAQVLVVLDDSPAQKAGISAGDVVIAIDGLKADSSNWQALVNNVGEHTVKVHAFRRDELMTFTLTPVQSPEKAYYLEVTDEAKANAWLINQK